MPYYEGDTHFFTTRSNEETVTIKSDKKLNIESSQVTINSAPIGTNKNMLLNSNFSVWRRGPMFTDTDTFVHYTADRWAVKTSGSEITIGKNTSINPGKTLMFITRDTEDPCVANVSQTLTIFNSRKLAGKYVTLSFVARRDSGPLSGSFSAQVVCQSTINYEVNFNYFYLPQMLINSTVDLTNELVQYTFTSTEAIPANVNQVAVSFKFNTASASFDNDVMYIGEVKLEEGSAKTKYIEPMENEEMNDLNYYYTLVSSGQVLAYPDPTVVQISYTLPVPMRAPIGDDFPNAVRYRNNNDYSLADSIRITDCQLNYVSNITPATTCVTNLGGLISVSGFTGLLTSVLQINPYRFEIEGQGFGYISFDVEI